MNKRTRKKVVKTVKKYPILIVVLLLLIAIVAGGCFLHYKRIVTIPFLKGVIPQEKIEEDYTVALQKNVATAGNVTGNGTFKEGTTTTLQATPNSGYTFEGWYDGSVLLSRNATYSYTVSKNVTITAKFIENTGGGDENGTTDELQIHFLEFML